MQDFTKLESCLFSAYHIYILPCPVRDTIFVEEKQNHPILFRPCGTMVSWQCGLLLQRFCPWQDCDGLCGQPSLRVTSKISTC